jgi:hypothetical protein
MAAAASYFELPPVTALTLVRDTLADELAAAEQLVAENRHDEAVEQLENLWSELRTDCVLALRNRLALSWSEMYRGELEHAAELLGHAETIVQSPRFDAGDRAEVLYRRGCVAFKSAKIADATSLVRCLQPTSTSGGRAVISSAATGTLPRVTRNGRSSLRRAWATSRRRHTHSSRHRASPNAGRNGL